jgi:hypothetical protein
MVGRYKGNNNNPEEPRNRLNMVLPNTLLHHYPGVMVDVVEASSWYSGQMAPVGDDSNRDFPNSRG